MKKLTSGESERISTVRTIHKIEAGEINILMTTMKRIQHAIGCPWSSCFNCLMRHPREPFLF
ncbi:MAG: hypothetical protein H0X34_13455 [Chthoniobacterales bacterium]|nr:hypothetical protein [Chthoniobacterales bacterium]